MDLSITLRPEHEWKDLVGIASVPLTESADRFSGGYRIISHCINLITGIYSLTNLILQFLRYNDDEIRTSVYFLYFYFYTSLPTDVCSNLVLTFIHCFFKTHFYFVTLIKFGEVYKL
jgi:hypothetical protein